MHHKVSENRKFSGHRKSEGFSSEFNIAPLSGAFMITSIVGFLISALYILPGSNTWGFTFVLFFTLMFVASLISMTYAPSDWPLKMGRK